jgi:tRNA(fMet)-specific endonuclease VapC
VILDTSILIAAERGAVRFEALLESLEEEWVGMAAITASELLHGCHRAAAAAVRSRRAAFVEAVLEAIPVVPFGLAEARRHAELWVELIRAGAMIGAHDLIIGATAVARGAALATFNQEEFGRVAGLRLVRLEPFRV